MPAVFRIIFVQPEAPLCVLAQVFTPGATTAGTDRARRRFLCWARLIDGAKAEVLMFTAFWGRFRQWPGALY